jgi:hypothetical protein
MLLRERFSSERGESVIPALLTLGLVLLTIAVAMQALAYAHARSVAQAAAQDDVEAASSEGTGAGIARADILLGAAGGVGANLRPFVQSTTGVVTVVVQGSAPHIFPGLDLMLPGISAKASAPVERYPQDETRQ